MTIVVVLSQDTVVVVSTVVVVPLPTACLLAVCDVETAGELLSFKVDTYVDEAIKASEISGGVVLTTAHVKELVLHRSL